MSISRGLGTSRVNLGCWGGERKFGGSSQVALVSEGFAEEFGGGVGIESRPEPGLWKVLNVGERSTDAWECFSCSPSALGDGVPCVRVISKRELSAQERRARGRPFPAFSARLRVMRLRTPCSTWAGPGAARSRGRRLWPGTSASEPRASPAKRGLYPGHEA